jgi:DNA-3-methyladenine glycosylase
MQELRKGRGGHELTNGPAKFCQAFAIDRKLNGHDLGRTPLKLLVPADRSAEKIVQTTRIGISRGQDVPWRFYLAGNPYVSKT